MMHSSIVARVIYSSLIISFTVNAASAEQQSYSGYLVDNKTADHYRLEHRASKTFDLVIAYDKKTALSRRARMAGYSIYTSRNWLRLDAHGNQLAVKMLTRTIRKHGFLVLLNGVYDHGVVITKSLTSMVGAPMRRTSR